MSSPRAFLILAIAMAARTAFALPPLAELEAQVTLSPESQLSDQAYEAARAQLNAAKISLGVSIYGGAGVGANRDIIDPTQSYAYRETSESIGVSLPVLGSRLQLRGALDGQEVVLIQLDARRELQRRELLHRLRKAYTDYWTAQRASVLAEDFLVTEIAVRHTLEERTRAGLLLDSDRLELETGFALARREAALAATSHAIALENLRSLTTSQLEEGTASSPGFAGCNAEPGIETRWADSDPELTALQHIVTLRDNDPRGSALYPIQSTIQAGYESRDQLNTGQHGSSGTISWKFQMPAEYMTQRHLFSRAAAAELSRSRLEYEVRRRELQTQRDELIRRKPGLCESQRLAAARLAAADAAVEERQQRASRLAGDVFEQLQRARLARYNAARTVIEADAALAVWRADWSRFDDPGSSASPGGGEENSRRAEGQRTLYVWRAADWLANAATAAGNADFLRLRGAFISRLLVSLNASEMERLLHDPTRLSSAVYATHQHGLQIGLLLGDPGWIEAAHRNELLEIIRGLASVAFDSLHLDIEPEQVAPGTSADPHVLAALVATLQAVVAVSPWPVELSTHPRNLDREVDSVSLGQTLLRLRIRPTLMIYVANPQRAVEIAAPLMRHYPELRFRVALSLEQSAPGGETLRAYPDEERRRRIEEIERNLQADNFDGISLQLEDGWSLARSQSGDRE
jgi:Outer membrane efflux protein